MRSYVGSTSQRCLRRVVPSRRPLICCALRLASRVFAKCWGEHETVLSVQYRHTMEDAKSRKLIVGASGASGTSAIVPWALNRIAGTHFQVVTGYASAVPQLLAMERGELEGVGSESLNDVLARRDWIDNGKATFLYTIATRRSTKLPDVPTIVEFAQNDLDRAVLRLLGSVTDIGLTVMAPPGVPDDRTAILREAFLKMVKDPDFLRRPPRSGSTRNRCRVRICKRPSWKRLAQRARQSKSYGTSRWPLQ